MSQLSQSIEGTSKNSKFVLRNVRVPNDENVTILRYVIMADKPNLTELMDMAQKMQKGMQDIQESLVNKELTGEAGAGMVKVVLNGQYDCKNVNITDNALQEDKGVLQDLIVAAFNAASEKVKATSKDAMMDVYRKTGAPLGEGEEGDQ